MKIITVLTILLSSISFSQEDCKTAINFFPRLISQNTKSADGLPTQKILKSELKNQDLKAISKLEKYVEKQAGNYASTLQTVKILKVIGETKVLEYLVNFKLTFTDIEYRFNAITDSKGKLKNELELPNLKGKSIQPACLIYKKALQDPDLENVVGIRLVFEKNAFTYEVFQKGEPLHTEKDYRSDIMRNKKSKHKIIRYNSFNGEKEGLAVREHVVIK